MVLVVAEEFGAFTDSRRRIDLLGVDRDGRLVVIELKRTGDGGHLELQALRYAAMVSVMTFDDSSDSQPCQSMTLHRPNMTATGSSPSSARSPSTRT